MNASSRDRRTARAALSLILMVVVFTLCIGSRPAHADAPDTPSSAIDGISLEAVGNDAPPLETTEDVEAPGGFEMHLSAAFGSGLAAQSVGEEGGDASSASSGVKVEGVGGLASASIEGGGAALIAQTDASGTCGTGVTWSLSDGTLTISGQGAMDDFSTTNVPGWNNSKRAITEVVIEQGVTKIGEQAFVSCTNLASVTVPSSVQSIGSAAFYKCSALEGITLPSAVKTLESGTFADCSSLATFKAPGLKKIKQYAMQGVAIDTFTVTKRLKSIKAGAFFKARIGAFAVASGNTAYTQTDGVLFGDSGETLVAYPAARGVQKYDVPAGVTKIGDMAFLGSDITQVTLPSTLAAIGKSAFQECESLTSVSLPDSLTEADDFAFYGCTALKSVRFGAGLKSTSYQMFKSCTSLTDITFGGLSELDAHTFARCTALVSVDLPATVTTIGTGAFGCDSYDSPKLQSITLRGVSEIPFQAFLNQKSLTSVTLNDKLTAIYRAAFLGCSSLAAMTIPTSTTFVHHWAFPEATKITCLNPKLSLYAGHGYQEQESAYISCTTDYAKAYQMLELVNARRAEAGLARLYMDESLLSAAMTRAGETAVLFSHTRPDSSTCFTANGNMIAENIASGQTSAEAAMTSFMNSSGHKDNILDASATTIGVGCVKVDGRLYWVQCFGSNAASADCAKPADRAYKQKVDVATRTFGEASTSPTIVVLNFGEKKEYTVSFSVTPSTKRLPVGKSAALKLQVKNPELDTFVPVARLAGGSWASSSNAVAVSASGTVTGKGAGTATVSYTGRIVTMKSKVTSTYKGMAFTKNGCSYTATSNTAARLVKAPNTRSVKVPAKVSYAGRIFKVTAIANGAFSASKATKKIVVGDSVAKVGAKTFADAENVARLALGAGVKSIGPKALAPMKKLKSLVVKTKRLTKASVKGSLKGSMVTKVSVKVGAKSTNARYAKKYARFFTEANAGKKVAVR